MKTTTIAATLAMLVMGPVFAAVPAFAGEPDSVPGATGATVNAEQVKTQPPSAQKPAEEASVPPQYVGPFKLHNGLLPNGLAPNPFNYG